MYAHAGVPGPLPTPPEPLSRAPTPPGGNLEISEIQETLEISEIPQPPTDLPLWTLLPPGARMLLQILPLAKALRATGGQMMLQDLHPCPPGALCR